MDSPDGVFWFKTKFYSANKKNKKNQSSMTKWFKKVIAKAQNGQVTVVATAKEFIRDANFKKSSLYNDLKKLKSWPAHHPHQDRDIVCKFLRQLMQLIHEHHHLQKQGQNEKRNEIQIKCGQVSDVKLENKRVTRSMTKANGKTTSKPDEEIQDDQQNERRMILYSKPKRRGRSRGRGRPPKRTTTNCSIIVNEDVAMKDADSQPPTTTKSQQDAVSSNKKNVNLS